MFYELENEIIGVVGSEGKMVLPKKKKKNDIVRAVPKLFVGK